MQQEWKNFQKIGAVSFALAGALYFIDFGLFAPLGNPPSEGQAFLNFVFQDKSTLQIVFTIFFFIDVLLIVGVTSLYFSLRQMRTPAVVGCITGVVALTIDLVNTILTYSLLGLGNMLAATTNDTQRIAYGAVGQLLSIVTLGIGLQFYFILFSSSIIAVSLGAVKVVGNATSYLGVVAGILGVAGGILGMIPLTILWPVWFVLLSFKLFSSRSI